MTLNVTLEKTNTNWNAYGPDEIGVVFSTGSTREEAAANFQEALRGHLKVMRELGKPTPEVSELSFSELQFVETIQFNVNTTTPVGIAA